MARPLYDSEYIFGIHEPGGERYMRDAGRPGWILFTEGIGADPQDRTGQDYRQYSRQGLGVITRLNNGYYPQGTIPHNSQYADFAQRCANFVAASQGCKIWLIGNEMNYVIERPRSVAAFDAPAPPAGMDAAGAEGEAVADDEVVIGEDDGPQGDFGAFLRRVAKHFLRSISGGMGDAELGNDPVEIEPADTLDASETGEDALIPKGEGTTVPTGNAQPDPYFRSDPQRFSALHAGEASDEAAGPTPQPQRDLRDIEWTQPITPQRYAECYRLCRNAIHAVSGHEDDQVLVGAVAPWNNQTAYPGNASGDWVIYFRDILERIGADACDGISLHTYTHQADPNLIHSDAMMNPPFHDRHYEFRAYQDFMHAIPSDMRHLPVYLTETDQDVPWEDRNIGWVQRAYGEIDHWNRQAGNQQIRALILYRWPRIDRWYITGKQGVIADFRDALKHDYRWRPQVPPADFSAGDLLATTDLVNLRQTPGYQGKAQDDLLATLPLDTRVTVLADEPKLADGLVWWFVEPLAEQEGTGSRGWLAQNSPTGTPLLRKIEDSIADGITVGSRVRTLTVVRMRTTPGYAGKSADDVVAELPPDREGLVLAGPQWADDLTWWRVRTLNDGRQPVEGWIAESDPAGVPLLEKVDGMAPPSTPGSGQQEGTFKSGDAVTTLDYLRVRRSPGYAGKDETDVVADVAPGTSGTVLGGPRDKDDLSWWQLKLDAEGGAVQGWGAEVAPNGIRLLAPSDTVEIPPAGDDRFRSGELVQAATHLRVRRSPGYSNKADTDVIGAYPPEATLNIIDGPQAADDLTWWRVGGIAQPAGELVGWAAETAPNGIVLMQRPAKLAGTKIPDAATRTYLGAPFRGRFGISQLWGERPGVYSQFSYDGVPLQGHNGIDFLTPNGTELLAVEDGIVSEVVYHDLSGFGNYVKLQHGWGESIYAHMHDMTVAPGQTVRRGDLIGHADNTGYSGGPHLHFAIRINPYERTDGWGGFSDPLPYMNPADFQLPPYVLAPGPARSSAPAPAGAASVIPAAGMAPDHPGVSRP